MPHTDFDQMAARIEGWATHFTQLAPGPGHGSVVETVLPAARLVRLVVDTPVALEALPRSPDSAELFHVGVISMGTGRPLWQGFPVRPDMLMLEQGDVPSRFALPPACELLVARLDRKRIESLCHTLRGGEDEPSGRRSQLRPHSVSVLEALRALLRFLARGDTAHDTARTDAAEGDLYERVASLLSATPTRIDPSPETRRRALRRAEEYIHGHGSDRLTISHLCAAADCSERTLRKTFRECYGTSPMAFLKKVRLQGLRRDLRDAAPDTDTIMRHALHWGFWHMGHLGRDYKRLFGETPSVTLGAHGSTLATRASRASTRAKGDAGPTGPSSGAAGTATGASTRCRSSHPSRRISGAC